ncbi:hypothetical protein PAPYR_3553 [Paratrimastix pyriformis]|uniref:F-box domain-containing protein n=1 Tax=Paratrimastix pyriformis TaxID=342808 RepID=A0ABQ8ULW2_9EUKA|nr:hypothetical protein PAPYR_3553 [Paratrimastix pyriformis]
MVSKLAYLSSRSSPPMVLDWCGDIVRFLLTHVEKNGVMPLSVYAAVLGVSRSWRKTALQWNPRHLWHGYSEPSDDDDDEVPPQDPCPCPAIPSGDTLAALIGRLPNLESLALHPRRAITRCGCGPTFPWVAQAFTGHDHLHTLIIPCMDGLAEAALCHIMRLLPGLTMVQTRFRQPVTAPLTTLFPRVIFTTGTAAQRAKTEAWATLDNYIKVGGTRSVHTPPALTSLVFKSGLFLRLAAQTEFPAARLLEASLPSPEYSADFVASVTSNASHLVEIRVSDFDCTVPLLPTLCWSCPSLQCVDITFVESSQAASHPAAAADSAGGLPLLVMSPCPLADICTLAQRLARLRLANVCALTKQEATAWAGLTIRSTSLRSLRLSGCPPCETAILECPHLTRLHLSMTVCPQLRLTCPALRSVLVPHGCRVALTCPHPAVHTWRIEERAAARNDDEARMPLSLMSHPAEESLPPWSKLPALRTVEGAVFTDASLLSVLVGRVAPTLVNLTCQFLPPMPVPLFRARLGHNLRGLALTFAAVTRVAVTSAPGLESLSLRPIWYSTVAFERVEVAQCPHLRYLSTSAPDVDVAPGQCDRWLMCRMMSMLPRVSVV